MKRLRALGALLGLLAAAPLPAAEEAVAVLGGGCFWCLEADIKKVPGVLGATSGYSGGPAEKANYRDVSTGRSGHVEVVQVRFDPERLPFEALLERYFRLIDPTDGAGQFCDRGPQYRPVIVAQDASQLRAARAALKALSTSGVLPAPVAVELLPAQPFYAAEPEHQNYAARNPRRYRYYRRACGRDARLAEVWAAERKAAE